MDRKTGRILIVDDNKDILQAARLFLKQHVQAVHTEETPDVVPGLLERGSSLPGLAAKFRAGESGESLGG